MNSFKGLLRWYSLFFMLPNIHIFNVPMAYAWPARWRVSRWGKKSHETFLNEKILGKYCVGLVGNEPSSEHSVTIHPVVSYLDFPFWQKIRNGIGHKFGLCLKSLLWADLGLTTFSNTPMILGSSSSAYSYKPPRFKVASRSCCQLIACIIVKYGSPIYLTYLV